MVIINMQPSNRIMPAHCEAFKELPAELRPSSVPNLSFNRLPITEIIVSVIRPMCAELGINNWWTQLAAAPQKKLKSQLANCIAKGKWQPDDPWVLKNKAYKWRGEDLEEGRIMAVFKVPNDQVQGVMALSGREGLIIDQQKPRAGE